MISAQACEWHKQRAGEDAGTRSGAHQAELVPRMKGDVPLSCGAARPPDRAAGLCTTVLPNACMYIEKKKKGRTRGTAQAVET